MAFYLHAYTHFQPPNTAGKTTLLNVLAGQVPASPNLDLTGRLFVNGRSVGGKGAGGPEHTQVGAWGLLKGFVVAWQW